MNVCLWCVCCERTFLPCSVGRGEIYFSMLPSVSRFLLVVTLSVAFGLAPRPPAKGVICQARVKSIAQFGAFCRMEDGVDGLIHISQLNPDGGRATSVDQWLTVGDTVAVRVLSVDDGKVALTLRDVVQGAEAPGLLSNWMPAARLGNRRMRSSSKASAA